MVISAHNTELLFVSDEEEEAEVENRPPLNVVSDSFQDQKRVRLGKIKNRSDTQPLLDENDMDD